MIIAVLRRLLCQHPVFLTILVVFVLLLIDNVRDLNNSSNHHEFDTKLKQNFRAFQKLSPNDNEATVLTTNTIVVDHSRNMSVFLNNMDQTTVVVPVPVPTAPLSAGNTLTKDDVDIKDWYRRLTSKYSCITGGFGALYLFHVRKAAGTSIKEVLEHASARFGVPTYSTEGVTLDMSFLSMPGVLTGNYFFTIISSYDSLSRSRCIITLV